MFAMNHAVVSFAVAISAAASVSAAEVFEYRFEPSADTTIFADVAGFERRWDDVSDGQGQSLWLSTTAGGVLRRSLIRFDLGTIPDGMQVVSATLTLYESRARDSHSASLHRMLAPWGEGASDGGGQGEGDQAEAGDATWRWRDYLVAEWGTRGGDFVASASASTLVGLPNASYTWGSSAGMVTDVQGWLADPAANHGWILIGPEIDAQNAKRFDSGESLTASLRPLLVVQVTPIPEPGTALLLALGTAALLLRRRGALSAR
jgi:PEP-CTERM motif